jgi:hypothetical protein
LRLFSLDSVFRESPYPLFTTTTTPNRGIDFENDPIPLFTLKKRSFIFRLLRKPVIPLAYLYLILFVPPFFATLTAAIGLVTQTANRYPLTPFRHVYRSYSLHLLFFVAISGSKKKRPKTTKRTYRPSPKTAHRSAPKPSIVTQKLPSPSTESNTSPDQGIIDVSRPAETIRNSNTPPTDTPHEVDNPTSQSQGDYPIIGAGYYRYSRRRSGPSLEVSIRSLFEGCQHV